MYLRKLEVHGFKSFAKKTVLEFEPGITSVVGPNGSGKSNIADALRWGFGEQSMKLLRSKKAEDIIFAGSDQKARAGVSEVQVAIDNTDRIMPLDYGEVVIARRMYRDGNSEYLINGSAVRLLDIEELMAKSGFAHSSYHVIGQGMIDALILGGPAAIKELLEEASGVKPYYMKRGSTMRKLEHTTQNLEKAAALIGEIEPRLRSLRRQAKRFEKRSDIEAELRAMQAMNFSSIFSALGAQLGEIKNRQNKFDAGAGALQNEIKKLKEESEKQESATQSGSQSYHKLRDDLNALHKKKLAMQEEQAMLRGRLKAGREQFAAFIPNWESIKKTFRRAYEKLKNLVNHYTPEAGAELEKLFADLQKQLEGQADANVQEENQKSETRLNALETELGGLIDKIEKLEADLEEYVKNETETKQQLFVKERLLRNKQDQLVKLGDQKNQLAVEQARAQTRMENHETEARAALGGEFHELIKAAPTPVSAPTQVGEEIIKLQKQLELIGGVDDLLLQEYRETEERFEYLSGQSKDLQKGVDDLTKIIAELDEVIKKDFDEAFHKISEKFAEYFRTLFGGGKATMNILKVSPPAPSENEEIGGDKEGVKPEITGIEIRATPPGKKLAGIAALSGGERALTAIALLSSILACFPSPFVVLDEVDAALDEANSIRFGKIVGTLADKTQFITITHNRETMRQSHTLYGVTMGDDGVSKLLSLKLEQAAVYSTKN